MTLIWTRLLIFACAVFCLDSIAFANKVTSIDLYRAEQAAKQFTGQFLHATASGGTDTATVVIENGSLQLWFAKAGNVLHNSFKVDLREVGKTHRTSEPRLEGWADIEKSITIQGNVVKKAEVLTTDRYMYIEEQSLTLSGTNLAFVYKRTFYKKKYVFFGPWVVDTKSPSAKRNTQSVEADLFKLSSVPMPLEAYSQMIRSRVTPMSTAQTPESASVFKLDDFRRKGLCRTILENESD